MPAINFDPNTPVDITVRAETVAVFRFTAQFRVPGSDYVDFATAKDSNQVSKSEYRTQLAAPLPSYTDIRISFLIDGHKGRPYLIEVDLSQAGGAIGGTLVCDGAIPDDGKMAFDSVEATLV